MNPFREILAPGEWKPWMLNAISPFFPPGGVGEWGRYDGNPSICDIWSRLLEATLRWNCCIIGVLFYCQCYIFSCKWWQRGPQSILCPLMADCTGDESLKQFFFKPSVLSASWRKHCLFQATAFFLPIQIQRRGYLDDGALGCWWNVLEFIFFSFHHGTALSQTLFNKLSPTSLFVVSLPLSFSPCISMIFPLTLVRSLRL